MLDEKSYVPNDSIFGGFDIVFCRNVLIYFNPEYQKIIFKKLYKALNRNGFLVLGEAEAPIGNYGDLFRRESNCSKIYRKLD
jgi:chemotaxis methyl-accepting protein methylase